MKSSELVEHFFRHEYGRLVAVLTRRVGVQHLEAVQDAAQVALLRALDTWKVKGLPEHPSAWVYRVARNELIGELRKSAGRSRILERLGSESVEAGSEPPQGYLEHEVRDGTLRMLFACCHDSVPTGSSLVFALQALGGFGTREIARILFISEANVYKRFARARDRLKRGAPLDEELGCDEVAERLPAVQHVLYLMFSEGYLSAGTDRTTVEEFAGEAIRLAELLAQHPCGPTPETHALLALMHLHAARLGARENGTGDLVLLEEQDRSAFDAAHIRQGLEWLELSARGDSFSRYHAEAGIAAEHCLAPSMAETRWDRVAECYALLEAAAPSPLHRLSRALAVAEWKGPAAGLLVLDGLTAPSWLERSYHYHTVLADLHRRAGGREVSLRHRDLALQLAPSDAVRDLIQRRFGP